MSYDVVQHWQDLRNRFRRDEDDVRGGIDAEVVWKTMIFLQLRFPLVWEALYYFVKLYIICINSPPHSVPARWARVQNQRKISLNVLQIPNFIVLKSFNFGNIHEHVI